MRLGGVSDDDVLSLPESSKLIQVVKSDAARAQNTWIQAQPPYMSACTHAFKVPNDDSCKLKPSSKNLEAYMQADAYDPSPCMVMTQSLERKRY